MAYNFTKKTCDVCGCKEPKPAKFASHADKLAMSFRLSYDGGVLCSKCHKEKELKSLFDLMDARDKQRKVKCFCGKDIKGHEPILAACKKAIKNKSI